MSPVIHVDDEVHAALRTYAQPGETPNATLRRLLEASPRKKANQRITLAHLLQAGLLEPGQRLTWSRRNSKRFHEAWVTIDGRLRLENGEFCATPTEACASLGGGSSFPGWRYWRTESGVSLDGLRTRLLTAVVPC